MPVSAVPSSRSTRNTNASDHTAVRRVSDAIAMNTATYAAPPTAAARNAAQRALGRAGDDRGERARRRDGDERDDRAAHPAAEHDLPRRRGREPREVERARAHFGAEHGVADDERGDRHDEPEDAVGRRRRRERPARDALLDAPRSASSAEQRARRARHQHRGPALAREARPQRVDEDRDERRPPAAVLGRRRRSRPRSSDQLPEQALERVVERAHLEQADRLVAREPRQRGRQLARAQRSRSRGRRAPASNVTPPTESSAIERRREAPAVVGAHEHVPRAGRPSRRGSRGARRRPRAGR